MRVLVTGATNAYGEAIVLELAAHGHHVRAFGVDPDDDRFDAVENVKTFPGWVETGGSVEPVLAEREALVHAACLDPVARGRDGKRRAAVRIQQGTLYTRYAAEREQVDHFIHVTPASPDRAWADLQAEAAAEAERLRGDITFRVVRARGDPTATAEEVADLLGKLPERGGIVGGHDNAVTA